MIVVFDSGVWISALQFGGTPLNALDSAIANAPIAVCDGIFAEVRKILKLKFKWSEARIDESLTIYAAYVNNFSVIGEVRGICRDPKDDMVLECAVLAGADYIISGDKDLTSLGSFEGIRVVTPRQFLDLDPAI